MTMEMKQEIMPLYTNVIIKPYIKNPYNKKSTLGGLLLSDGEFENGESGEKDMLNEGIGCAQVIEVGPKCLYAKIGDDVFYDTRSVRPIPFLGQGFIHIAEQNLLTIMNNDLSTRFKDDE